jgi:amino-acid N-acetyltransferase
MKEGSSMSVQFLQPNTKTAGHLRQPAVLPVASARIRPGEPKDVAEIAALINHYAALGQMLPRKEESVRQNIHEFIVTEAQHKVIACGALHRWDDESAEVRSLAVAEEYAGQGLGKQIVNELLEMGRKRGFAYAFALTLQVRFFEKLHFEVVKKSVLPQKIWGDCIICPFLYNCHETAVLLRFRGAAN